MNWVIQNQPLIRWIALAVSFVMWPAFLQTADRTDFDELILIFSVLFLAYGIYVYSGNNSQALWQGLGAAIIFRLLFMVHIPDLSDDVYRFIWDGRLLIQGMDPFAHPPSYYMQAQGYSQLTGITQSLYQKLNSPDYFTIYPPVCQSIFALAAWLFPKDTFGAIMVIRSGILLFELGSIFLIYRLQILNNWPYRTVLLYALNPMVIMELSGNLHFEAGMIFFLLLAFWWLQKEKLTYSAMAFGGAVMTKLLPLALLPSLINRIGLKKAIYYGFIVLLITVLGFTPFITAKTLNNLFDSINLYFQTFEFNAALYYLIRWVGEWWVGYNLIALIGPALAFIAGLLILFYAYQEPFPEKTNWPKAIASTLTIYLLFSTIVHPWYITPVLAFGILSGYYFPLIWSFSALLSYAAYGQEPVQVPLICLILEYGILIPLMLWEIRRSH